MKRSVLWQRDSPFLSWIPDQVRDGEKEYLDPGSHPGSEKKG
jgi:hypothetical protein